MNDRVASIIAFFSGRWGQMLAYALAGLLVLFALINMGKIAYRLVRGVGVESPVSERYQAKTTVTLENIAKWHLMGEVPPSDLDAKALPKSLLNASLVGVFSATPNENATVAIKFGDGKEKIFQIGDKLPGGVVVHDILTDSVILKRGARYEVMALPSDKLKFEPASKPLDFKKYQD